MPSRVVEVPRESCVADEPTSEGRATRGVLDGAFVVLDALADAEDGLGLTALARSTGLAKTSAYRLAEQLTDLGAVQRVQRRYYIGPRIGHMGQRWQPDPALRQAGQAPVHSLAVQARAMASLRILHEGRLRVICATVPNGLAYLSSPADAVSTARTATGRVLHAARTDSVVMLPDCWSAREWRRLRASVREPHATVVDDQDVFPGVCCVCAPVWSPDGTCTAAVTALFGVGKPTARVRDLVVHTARSIAARLP
ncbi:IclR family transcriptional regulator [Mycolicibacterium hodleri]|nr:helix-turn-helix domain-containing protein [Mycolicibacterium hodleri]